MVFVGSIVSWSLVHSVPHSVAATGETVSILQLDSRRQQEQVLKIAGGLSSAMATLSRGKPSGRKPDHKARQQRAADAYAVMSNTTAGFAQLAEDSIHGHHDQPIPEDIVLNPMLETLNTLKTGLIDEIKDLQDLVDNSNDDVTQCNTVLNDHFDQAGGITDKNTAVGSARDNHRTCRQNEETADNDQKIACQGFEDARSSPSCEHTSEWFAVLPGSCTPSLDDVVTKAKDCETKKTIFAPMPDQCDLQQEQLESDFCSYAVALADACSDHDACYTRTAERKTTVDDDVKQLETSHKQLFGAVEKCECYIGVVQLARTQNLTKSDIETCNNKESNTADLDVTYPVAANKADCNPEDHKPGDEAWTSAEYSGLSNQAALEPVTGCLSTDTGGAAQAYHYFLEGVAFGAKESWWPGLNLNAYAGRCIDVETPSDSYLFPWMVPRCYCQVQGGHSDGTKECVNHLSDPDYAPFAAASFEPGQCVLHMASGSVPDACPTSCKPNMWGHLVIPQGDRSPKRDGGIRFAGTNWRDGKETSQLGCFVRQEFAATEDDVKHLQSMYTHQRPAR